MVSQNRISQISTSLIRYYLLIFRFHVPYKQPEINPFNFNQNLITMKRIKHIFTFTVLLALSVNAIAQDWPQFLGPDRNSTSPQKGILRSWPANGPEVLWTADLKAGFGGPVIKDGKAYLLDRDDKYGDYMRCFDMTTGKELWKYGYEAPGTVEFPGSRSVPAVDDKYVYSCGHNGDLYCH